jgi:hypothetical protein
VDTPELLRIVTLSSTVIGALFMFGKLTRVVWRFNRRVGHAIDVIIGVPAIGEAPERPGVIARLEKIEREIQPNHGTSMRDTINVIRESVARVESTLQQHIDSHNKSEE